MLLRLKRQQTLEFAKELSEDEKEHLKQLLTDHKKKYTMEVASQAIAKPNIEALKQYLGLGIKLIPVHDDGAFISTGNPIDWGTDDIAEIQSLISGKGYRNVLGRESKIKLFRFFPIDYGLAVIDID